MYNVKIISLEAPPTYEFIGMLCVTCMSYIIALTCGTYIYIYIDTTYYILHTTCTYTPYDRYYLERMKHMWV